MVRIDIASELVLNHSTEEVMNYLTQSLKKLNYAFDQYQDKPERLIACSTDVRLLAAVAENLNKKLNPNAESDAVVA